VPDSAEEQWENKGFCFVADPKHSWNIIPFGVSWNSSTPKPLLFPSKLTYLGWGPILRNPHTTQPRLTVNLVKVRDPHHNMFWNPRKKLQKSDIQYESVNIYFSFLRWYYLYVYIYIWSAR
jgi:hypothetical protein